MTSRHPKIEVLHRFMRATSTSSENREVVAHLLSNCRECRAITRAARWLPTREVSGHFEKNRRTLAASIETERAEAPRLWQELQGIPHARRQMLVRNSRRFRTWPLCGLLIDRAFELGFDTPAEALPIAELAVDISLQLDPDDYSEPLLQDLRARALGYQANALRINSDLRSAERLLSQAFELLEEGTGDVLDQAELLKFQASLRSDQALFEESIKLQRKAVRLYRSVGDSHMEGRAMISLGCFQSFDGKPKASVVTLRMALEKLNPHEPRWILSCRHNLARSLRECGHLPEALELLGETRSLYASVADSVSLLRLLWLEAELARDLGNLAYAEKSLRAVCEGFTDQGMPSDAALACLEVAELCLRQGRTREVLDLTQAVAETFEALGTQTQALVAVTLFRQAVQKDTVTRTLINEIRTRLEKSE